MGSVTLDSLVGEHTLDGVDFDTEEVEEYFGGPFCDASVVRFRLDGKVYLAIEDPDDGYRSRMKKLVIFPSKEMLNVFPPVRVLAMKRRDSVYENDILDLIDVVTGKPVLEVGTHDVDDYYPYFVAIFNPQNMATNQDKSGGN